MPIVSLDFSLQYSFCQLFSSREDCRPLAGGIPTRVSAVDTHGVYGIGTSSAGITIDRSVPALQPDTWMRQEIFRDGILKITSMGIILLMYFLLHPV
jgi:hypothetical protein